MFKLSNTLRRLPASESSTCLFTHVSVNGMSFILNSFSLLRTETNTRKEELALYTNYFNTRKSFLLEGPHGAWKNATVSKSMLLIYKVLNLQLLIKAAFEIARPTEIPGCMHSRRTIFRFRRTKATEVSTVGMVRSTLDISLTHAV